MKRLNRRSFLAASAATFAAPALAAPTPAAEYDAVIVGAGAAGIAAARRFSALGRKITVIEAAPRIGGRCVTDGGIFGVPFDRGAHWIHMPEINPVAKLAAKTDLEIYPASITEELRIGRRNAREGELEDFLGARVRANRAIIEAARGKNDTNCESALPRDLRDWRPTMEFVLGAYGCGKELREVSVFDFAKSAERDVDAFCRQGYGTLLARLGANLPMTLANPVTRIEWGSTLAIETEKGRLTARALIITASTSVLASGKIKFVPDLPKRQLDALNQLKLGSYDHVALELPGNPLGLQRDELVFEKADSAKTAALLANVSGTSLAMVEVGGRFGRDLSDQGDEAMIDFASEWLAGLFGDDVKKAIRRTHATRWNAEPWVRGAFSAASPGGQGARKTLMEPLHDRIWFAGEAVHETLWGTVGGAWESGSRAAEAILRKQGLLKEPLPPNQKKPAAPEKRPAAAQRRRT